mmetsp:Transcript_62280/g.129239  ORF Transcript_62280/g.129239 Transcript_62280/m.129239 type:complete len:81 (-) Transcript_62280:171-413(-)
MHTSRWCVSAFDQRSQQVSAHQDAVSSENLKFLVCLSTARLVHTRLLQDAFHHCGMLLSGHALFQQSHILPGHLPLSQGI